MATRGISLGRIIDWFHNVDIEEALYVHQRASDIVKKRLETVSRADAHHAAKSARGKKSHHKQPQPKDTRTVAEVIPEAPRPTESSETKAASAS